MFRQQMVWSVAIAAMAVALMAMTSTGAETTSGSLLCLDAADAADNGAAGVGSGTAWVNKGSLGFAYNGTVATVGDGSASWAGNGTAAAPYTLQLRPGSNPASGGYVQVANTYSAGNPLDLKVFTYEVWAKINGNGSSPETRGGTLIGHSNDIRGQGNGSIGYAVTASSSWEANTLYMQGGATAATTFPDSTDLVGTGYHQIVLARAGSGSTDTAWYLDGMLKGTFQSDSDASSDARFLIGGRHWGPAHFDFFANADIAIVRVYGTALTGAQVLRNFSANRGRFGLALKPIRLGSSLELMVDDYLMESMSGARLVLHQPTKREVAIDHDAPWEGNNCGFHTVFRDGDLYRMYYLIAHLECGTNERRKEPANHLMTVAAYAESKDGIHWVKPELGQFEFAGSKKNNIIMWDGYEKRTECFLVPFKDANPNCAPDARYKSLVRDTPELELWTLKSPDGIHWSRLSDKAVITRGEFDSENLAFWDAVRGEYRAYFRGYRNGLRDILTATSQDFAKWTEPVWVEYPGSPPQELYTNQIAPYYRAPQIFLGFPTRYTDRGWTPSLDMLPELEHRKQRAKMSPRYGSAITDGLFMSSRDGVTFKRWGEAFLRPGPQELGEWLYGGHYQNWGLVETKSDLPGAPNELSMYAVEGCWRGTANRMRRYTIRIDGFVSLQAPLSGGECVTKPLTFSGSRLVINYASSAAGSIVVEIQDADGKPIPGFAAADCPAIFGDSLERTVKWKGGEDVSKLAGWTVRLRILLKDADLYSFLFK